MSISAEDVRKIANLSQIGLTDEEINQFQGDLKQILTMAEKMNSTKTQDVAPLAHPTDSVQPRRDDVVTEKDERDTFQAIAPNTQSGLYIVPKVID